MRGFLENNVCSFDFPGSACLGKRVILMDVEPAQDTLHQLKSMLQIDEEYRGRLPQQPLDIIYHGMNRYTSWIGRSHHDRFKGQRGPKTLPYAIAQVFCAYKRIPVEPLLGFLRNHSYRPGMGWIYGRFRHGHAYDRGVDELFLNEVVIPFAQESGKSHGAGERERKAAIAGRFWAVIRRLVAEGRPWMPLAYMQHILLAFDGAEVCHALIVYKGHQLETVMMHEA